MTENLLTGTLNTTFLVLKKQVNNNMKPGSIHFIISKSCVLDYSDFKPNFMTFHLYFATIYFHHFKLEAQLVL